MNIAFVSRVSFPCISRILRSVDRRLQAEFKSPRHNNKADPFNELVFILLSSQTNELNYLRSYRQLKVCFPQRDDLIRASRRKINRAILCGGLGARKSEQLVKITQAIYCRFGKLSLTALKKWTEQEVEDFLTSLPGIGKKSARCVMMYSYGLDVFPVDTNIFRIMKRWGWWQMLGPIRKYEDAIQDVVPKEIRYSLHVNLIAHGRKVCTQKNPNCQGCVIKRYCLYAKHNLDINLYRKSGDQNKGLRRR